MRRGGPDVVWTTLDEPDKMPMSLRVTMPTINEEPDR